MVAAISSRDSRDAGPSSAQLGEPLELRHADGGRHLVEPVVVAQANVPKPGPVRIPALVPEAAHRLGEGGVVGDHHPTLPRRDLLVRVEGEDGEVPQRGQQPGQCRDEH